MTLLPLPQTLAHRRYALWEIQIPEPDRYAIRRGERIPYDRTYSPFIRHHWKVFQRILRVSWEPLVRLGRQEAPCTGRKGILVDLSDYSFRYGSPPASHEDIHPWFDRYLELYISCSGTPAARELLRSLVRGGPA